jgi:hypothetical protein
MNEVSLRREETMAQKPANESSEGGKQSASITLLNREAA